MSSLFRRVMSVYSNYFNIEHNCQGSLIEGNYRAIPITSTYYLINAFLYVHLNPVKHTLVKDAKDYPYSSLKFYLDPKRSPRWVKINKEILSEVDFTRINFYIKDTENWEGLI